MQAEEFTVRYTGAEANAAVSLAQFGVEAFVVSKVPAHEIGQACLNALRRSASTPTMSFAAATGWACSTWRPARRSGRPR